MAKRLVVLLLAAGSLSAFEDVSFSARTLGLGGDQAAVADDAFSPIVNPALPARWQRPVTSICAVPYSGNFYWTAAYSQPVRGLGNIGGSLLYLRSPGFADRGSGDADVRFFWAIPCGPYFNLGAAIGNHSTWRSPEFYFHPFEGRFTTGAFFSVGGVAFVPKGFNLGFSLAEMPFDLSSPAIFRTGIGWGPGLKKPGVLSSLLLAANTDFRFGSNAAFKLHLGAETYLFRGHLGLRAGMRYGTDELSGFSPTLGVTLRTHRLQKTDFELCYGTALNYGTADTSMILHQLSLSVLFGDARKAEKDSILAEQAERARRLREEALARERDRLRAELENINKERAAIERERADIERLRREALEEVGRIHGLGIVDTDSLINITLTDQALRFDEGSVQIPFPQGYRTLDRVASFLYHYPNNKIVVEVHTDIPPPLEPSTDVLEEPSQDQQPKYKDAKALTASRARIIRLYFVEVKGMSASNITAKGAGDAKPVADNETEAGRAANRRVEITIVK